MHSAQLAFFNRTDSLRFSTELTVPQDLYNQDNKSVISAKTLYAYEV